MTGLTLTEKIIGSHRAPTSLAPGSQPSEPPAPRQGDFVLVRPRRILTHDNTAAVIPKFNALFAGGDESPAAASAMFDRSQPVLALDHDIQNHSSENLGRYASIERFAREHDLRFHRAGSGIGHQLMLEQGHVLPGTLVVASDSHANAYGALGALGLPVVRTDAAVIWATGSTWWHIPSVVNIHVVNALPRGATGKDAIIALCSRFPTEAQNAAVEFTGDGLRTLSISDRIAIANMTTEWGAIACVMQPDEAVSEYLASRAVDLRAPHAVHRSPDPDAHYARTITLDLSTVEPSVAGPNRTDLAAPVSELAAQRIRIDVAYLLSCVNARLPDLAQAAEVVRNRRVHPLVTLYIAAASADIQRQAEALGIWQTLLASGATPLPSGCGPCIGLGAGTLRPNQTAISATNRNFPGRMGDRSAQVYLASPAIVAASAVAGYITTPALLDEERTHQRGTKNTETRGCQADPRQSRREEAEQALKLNTTSPTQSMQPIASSPGVALRPTPPRRTSACSATSGFSSLPRAILIPEPDISTDAIYAGRHTYRNDMTPSDMASVIFENLDPAGAPSIAPHISRGDILLAGRNFGRGSSREQAATALKHRGVAAVIAVSINATYLRNAINNGLLALECPELDQVLPTLADLCADAHMVGELPHPRLGPTATLDLDSSMLTLHVTFTADPATRLTLPLRPLAPFMRSLLNSGGVEPWARAMIHHSQSATHPARALAHPPSTLCPQSPLIST